MISPERFGCTSCNTNQKHVCQASSCDKAEVENQTRKKVKCLRTDNGTEYANNEFRDFCEQHGIKRHFTVCKTPQQNGVVERINRSIAERARCLRLNAGLAKIFWVEVVSIACYLISRSPRDSTEMGKLRRRCG
jgi:transposase InsO family protein